MKLSDYKKEGFLLAIDRTVSLLYGFFFIFFVIRILPKEQYGVFTIVQSLFYFLMMVNNSLILRAVIKFNAEEKKSPKFLPNSFYLSCCIFLLVTLLIIMFRQPISLLFKSQAINFLILIPFPILVISTVIKNFFLSVFISNRDYFKMLVNNAVYYIISMIGISYILIYSNLLYAYQVFLVNSLGGGLASIISIFLGWKIIKSLDFSFSFKQISRLLSYGKFSLGAGIGNKLFEQADIYLLGAILGPVELAVYHSAKFFNRFYLTFSQLINTFVLPLASEFSSKGKKEDLKQLFEKISCFYSAGLGVLNFIFIIFASIIFSIIYSGKYDDAVNVFIILIIGQFIRPLSTVSSTILYGINRPHVIFKGIWISSVLNILLNLFLIKFIGIEGAAVATVISFLIFTGYIYLDLKRMLETSLISIFIRYKDAYKFIRQYI